MDDAIDFKVSDADAAERCKALVRWVAEQESLGWAVHGEQGQIRLTMAGRPGRIVKGGVVHG